MRKNIIKAALFTPGPGGRWGLPLFLVGEPGVAKSAIVEEVAREAGLPVEVLSPGERGEGAFGVVPVPVKSDRGVVLTYPRPDWTDKVEPAGVVFVDEVTTAPPALQAPLLGLVLARRVGAYQLGARVRVVGAYNPPALAAGGFDLAPALANRAGHLDWGPPSAEEHAAYMMSGAAGNGGPHAADPKVASDEEARVTAAWADPWAKARGAEVAFLTRRPNLKNACPPAGDPKASRGWPSDRSWEMATRALASAAVHGLPPGDMEVFVECFVGEEVASEFFEFLEQADLPDPAALLDGRERFAHTAARVDRTAAVFTACAALVTPEGATRRKERAAALWQLLADFCAAKADLDVAAPCVQALAKAGLHTADKVAASKTLSSLSGIVLDGLRGNSPGAAL